jgi:hypothetical protein
MWYGRLPLSSYKAGSSTTRAASPPSGELNAWIARIPLSQFTQ